MHKIFIPLLICILLLSIGVASAQKSCTVSYPSDYLQSSTQSPTVQFTYVSNNTNNTVCLVYVNNGTTYKSGVVNDVSNNTLSLITVNRTLVVDEYTWWINVTEIDNDSTFETRCTPTRTYTVITTGTEFANSMTYAIIIGVIVLGLIPIVLYQVGIKLNPKMLIMLTFVCVAIICLAYFL